MTKREYCTNGFTLIELIIYIALFSMIVGSLVLFSWNIIYGGEKSKSQNAVEANMHYALERIQAEIRDSSGIGASTPTSITLTNLDGSRSPTVIDLSSGQIRIGFGSSGNCKSSTPCPITDNTVNVSSLHFTNLSNGTISNNISVSITIDSTGGRKEYQYGTSAQTSAEIRSD
jgi:type II secretory pathway pseudopilin PulG